MKATVLLIVLAALCNWSAIEIGLYKIPKGLSRIGNLLATNKLPIFSVKLN